MVLGGLRCWASLHLAPRHTRSIALRVHAPLGCQTRRASADTVSFAAQLRYPIQVTPAGVAPRSASPKVVDKAVASHLTFRLSRGIAMASVRWSLAALSGGMKHAAIGYCHQLLCIR